MKSFASDYACKPHPDVVQAMTDACIKARHNSSYGGDEITQEALSCLRNHFGKDSYAFFVSNGTAANRLALQTVLTRPYESVLCTESAHINTAEAGALESLGHKLITVPSTYGMIDIAALDKFVRQQEDIHLTYPRVLSISNATEVGTVHKEQQFHELVSYAVANDLVLHIDGIRLANAAAFLKEKILGNVVFGDEHNPNLVVTLGATKNGGMLGDAVIFFSKSDAEVATRLQKQQGQLCARTYCIAAQIAALYGGDLWYENAANANRMAQLLARQWRSKVAEPVFRVESNAVFMRLPRDTIQKLQQKTSFYVWDEDQNIVRWMCSWDTTEDDVEELIQLIIESWMS